MKFLVPKLFNFIVLCFYFERSVVSIYITLSLFCEGAAELETVTTFSLFFYLFVSCELENKLLPETVGMCDNLVIMGGTKVSW